MPGCSVAETLRPALVAAMQITSASSSTLASVEGTGMPMLPVESSMFSGLEIAAGEVSVKP